MKRLLALSLLCLPILLLSQISGYDLQQIQGYQVYIESDALADHQEVANEAIALLSDKLEIINELGLRADILDSLQAVTIFMDWNTTTGAAVYHPGLQWLINNGYIEEKWKAVEISNMTNFVNWSNQNQPYMVMHELAHAYHDRVLGFGYQPIIDAYEGAMAAELYESVSYHAGSGFYFDQEAYAATNYIEYFAELTEAYLGENDFFPFFREDIEPHDPAGYEVVVDVWQFETTSTEDLSDVYELTVYPNPVNDILHVQGQSIKAGEQVRIFSADGKVWRQIRTMTADRLEIDLSTLAAGHYFVELGARWAYPFIKE